MRERVAVHGGAVRAGPVEGGWQVVATIPLAAPTVPSDVSAAPLDVSAAPLGAPART